MTSRDFNGTTSTIDADSTGGQGAKTVGPWSACVWAKWDGAGEGTTGTMFLADTNAFIVRLHNASNVIRVFQGGSTPADAITSALFSTGVWYCLVATFDGANCHLYYGTETDRHREATYTTNNALITFTNWAVRVFVGNNSVASATFDGRLMHAAVLDWVMDRTDMERYRQGDLTALFARGNPRTYFTLQDGAAGVDSSRRNQTINTNGIGVSQERPRVPFRWDWARGRRAM